MQIIVIYHAYQQKKFTPTAGRSKFNGVSDTGAFDASSGSSNLRSELSSSMNSFDASD